MSEEWTGAVGFTRTLDLGDLPPAGESVERSFLIRNEDGEVVAHWSRATLAHEKDGTLSVTVLDDLDDPYWVIDSTLYEKRP